MPRTRILAERIADPATAALLRAHVEDRERLLAHLLTAFRDDPRIRAGWLWGSFGRGEADDLSDLDPWLVVADGSDGGMGVALRRICETAGELVHCGENPANGPAGGGYLGALFAGRHGLLQVDLYWQPASSAEIPETGLLFDRKAEPLPALPAAEAAACPDAPEARENRIKTGVAFAWLMLSIAAKHLARDPEPDLGLMRYAREGFEQAIDLLGLRPEIGALDWSAPASVLAKIDRIRDLSLVNARVVAAARAEGIALSKTAAPALLRYCDLVKRVLEAGGFDA